LRQTGSHSLSLVRSYNLASNNPYTFDQHRGLSTPRTPPIVPQVRC